MYWYSPSDYCEPGPDMANHGNVNLSVWLMQKFNTYYTQNNVKV